MLNVLCWLFFGLVVGVVAKRFHPGEEPLGLIQTVLVGLAGSFLGGGINYLLSGSFELRPAGFFMSIVGTIVILAFLRWVCIKNAK